MKSRSHEVTVARSSPRGCVLRADACSHWACALTFYGLLLCLLGVPTEANEKLLRDALRKDNTLGDLTGRMGDMTERQQLSNVYQPAEVERTDSSHQNLEAARSTSMKAVIDELSEALQLPYGADMSGPYAKTREHYRELLELLRGIQRDRGQELADREQIRELLEEQAALLEETEALQEELAQRQPEADDLERFADLAERQEALSLEAESPEAQQSMQNAEKSLSEMQPAEAAQHQQLAIKQLQKELQMREQASQQSDAGSNEQMAELAAQLQQMQSLDRDLQEMEDSLRRRERSRKPPPPAYQQETAERMDEAAKGLSELELPEAAKDVYEGLEKMMAEQWDPAADELRDARQHLHDARQQLMAELPEAAEEAQQQQQQQQQEQKQEQQQQQQRQQQQQQQQTSTQAGEDDEPREHGLAASKARPPEVRSSWQARLPEREREALLSARKAKYSLKWEHEVKRYFVELSK